MNPSYTRISDMRAVIDRVIIITLYIVLCISEKSRNNKALALRASEDRQKLFGVSDNPIKDYKQSFPL